MGYHAKTGVISHPHVKIAGGCLHRRSAGSSFWGICLPYVLAGYLGCFASAAGAQSIPLSVQAPPAQRVFLSAPLRVQLEARGGTAPYVWKLLEIPLPKGLTLNKQTGLISGAPQVAGEFKVPIAVDDSSAPAQEARADLYITIIGQLEVRWQQVPEVRDGGISGSVIIANNTSRPLQLTVIILAVNKIDKAFALGYQHFELKPNIESPPIPFGSSLPFGSYLVNVDAIAEEPVARQIFRSRIESDRRLILQQQP